MNTSPVLTDIRWKNATASSSASTMSVAGVATATGVLLACLLVTAAIGWSQVEIVSRMTVDRNGLPVETFDVNFPAWVLLPMFAALILGIVTAFKPMAAIVTGPLYALGYGFALGAVSHIYEADFDGIVTQAVLATVGVFVVMWVLYTTRVIKVTRRFIQVVIGATLGIAAMYLVALVASLFGADFYFWRNPSPLGIAVSAVIAIVAALNLAIDFDFIERQTAAGAPKRMEWFAAFGLTVTLIWLYLELLRLLSLLRR